MNVKRLAECDKAHLLDFFLKLSAPARKMRFCAVTKDDTISRYVHRLNMASIFVLGVFEPATDVLIGVVEVMPHDGMGEVGITLADGYRGRGLGRELFDVAIEVATKEGLTQLMVHTGYDNRPMLALAQRYKMHIARLGTEITATMRLEKEERCSLSNAVAETSMGA